MDSRNPTTDDAHSVGLKGDIGIIPDHVSSDRYGGSGWYSMSDFDIPICTPFVDEKPGFIARPPPLICNKSVSGSLYESSEAKRTCTMILPDDLDQQRLHCNEARDVLQ